MGCRFWLVAFIDAKPPSHCMAAPFCAVSYLTHLVATHPDVEERMVDEVWLCTESACEFPQVVHLGSRLLFPNVGVLTTTD